MKYSVIQSNENNKKTLTCVADPRFHGGAGAAYTACCTASSASLPKEISSRSPTSMIPTMRYLCGSVTNIIDTVRESESVNTFDFVIINVDPQDSVNNNIIGVK